MIDASPQNIRKAARLFKVLAHPARLKIACRIADGGPTTQKALIEELGWPQSSMARHLAPLRELGLVRGRRNGAEVLLEAGSEVTRELMAVMCRWVHPERAAAGAGEAEAVGYGAETL